MWKRLVKEWFSFSRSERRGIVVLCLLLLLAVVMPFLLRSTQALYTNDYQGLKRRIDSLAPLLPDVDEAPKTSFERADREGAKFHFDPNTIGTDSLLLLGFSPKQVAAILRYRERGGKFRTAESFLKLSVTSNHQYLAGYIRIPQREKASGGFARRDSTTFQRRYEIKAALPTLDINTADTALLKTLPGIGDYFAQRIVEHRQKLGGYTHVEQLCEINHFGAERLERIRARLTVDLSRVQKIALTENAAAQLRTHPYVGAHAARGIARQAKYSGGTTTLQELVQNQVLTEEQAAKLQEYVGE